MAYSIREHRQSPVIRLREDLEHAEWLLPQLSGSNIEQFLQLLDRIDEQFEALADSGLDLRPEETRWTSLHSRLARQPGKVVSPARKAGGLSTLRDRNPPAESFWWYLDRRIAEERRRSLRRLITIVGSIVLLLAGAFWVMETFFPPDPNVLLVSGATNELPELAAQGRWSEALTLIRDTKAQLTQMDPELLIWEAVALEQLGREGEAGPVLAQAQDLIGEENRALFWVTLGNVRVNTGDLDGAEEAAERALAIDREQGQVYFLLGNVAESRGDIATAVDYYQRTFELSLDSNPQLAVISRVRMGTLLQRSGASIPGEGTPLPGSTPPP